MSKAFGPPAFTAVGDQVRTNMALFSEAMKMFSPFRPPAELKEGEAAETSELDRLKEQMAEMQKKLEALSRK